MGTRLSGVTLNVDFVRDVSLFVDISGDLTMKILHFNLNRGNTRPSQQNGINSRITHNDCHEKHTFNLEIEKNGEYIYLSK